jgi:hypothetical protein
MYITGIWIVDFLLLALGYCCVVVTKTWIISLCFYAEDCCDGVVMLPCAGIEIFGFLLDDVVLRPLPLVCFLLVLILAVRLDAYFPLDPRVLVV